MVIKIWPNQLGSGNLASDIFLACQNQRRSTQNPARTDWKKYQKVAKKRDLRIWLIGTILRILFCGFTGGGLPPEAKIWGF